MNNNWNINQNNNLNNNCHQNRNFGQNNNWNLNNNYNVHPPPEAMQVDSPIRYGNRPNINYYRQINN